MSEEKITEILEIMGELLEDSVVPKNIKAKIENAKNALEEEADVSIRVNKALDQLEEISDDTNMEPYTRSQIWNIVSALEMILLIFICSF